MRILILAAVAALVSAPVGAQAPAPTAAVRAMAAGYKALTVCSALKTAEASGGSRTVESVEAHELVGVYGEIDGLVRAMPVEVGPTRVAADWDPTMPPRIALWDPEAGCRIMPVGWAGEIPASATGRSEPRPDAGLPMAYEAVAQAQAASTVYGVYGGVTTAVVVLRGDRVAAEVYAPGFGPDTPQRTWSVAKSLAGTIIGAAVQRGEAEVYAPAAIADWSRPGDPRAAITLDNLMRMASGLTSDTAGNRTDALYFGGVGVDEQATTWPLIAPPGTQYRYANNDTLLAVLAIAPTFASHPPNALFRRLGMNRTWAETDWRGAYILSSQVWTTARDLARFGRLYLNDGVVGGERILPEGWREYVSSPSGPQPGGALGYGATFWLMNHSEGVPPDTFLANGNRGQYVIVVPSRNIVIVRRGEDPAGQRFDVVAFTRDLLAAME